MTRPVEPVRPPLVEPAAPTKRVVRRREEPQDDSRREPRQAPERDEDDEIGLHVDVLA